MGAKTNIKKKKGKDFKSKPKCPKILQNVIGAAQNAKCNEFSLRKKTMEVNNTVMNSNQKKNNCDSNGKSNCISMFQNVLTAAHNSKSTEFSLKRNSIELSDTLKKSIKESKKNTLTKSLEFKSCSIQLSRMNSNKDAKSTLKQKKIQVLTATHNSKSNEFSHKRKPTELSGTPKKSKVLTATHNSKSNEFSHKRKPTELSGTPKKSKVNMSPGKKSNAVKSIKGIKRKPAGKTLKKYIYSVPETKMSLIPVEIEHEINNYAKEAMTLGWSLMKKYLPYFIQHCINKRELDVFSNGLKLLANNLPSTTFTRIYMRKYESIYKDILEEKSFNSFTSMDEKNLFYFNLCWHLINQYAIRSESFLNSENKNRIFCCGDYSFTSDYKNIIEITEGLTNKNKKKGENVFFCTSATGKVFNPLVINKGITVNKYDSSIYADNKYWQQASEDGNMCAEAFHHWLITAFRPHLVNENIKMPVILFFNSDSPYLSIPVLDFCKENEIILFSIPSQLSNLVNPLNMSCFDALGMEYCRIFRKRAEETVGRVKEFSPLILIAAMDRINFYGCAQSAFEQSGLLKKESYSQGTNKKSTQFNIEDRLPSHLKNNSYELGKQVGKLMCYQELMTNTVPGMNANQTSDVDKRFFNRIKKLYLEQSEKCTEMLDFYDDCSQTSLPEVSESPCILNSMITLKAENILRVRSPTQINIGYKKV